MIADWVTIHGLGLWVTLALIFLAMSFAFVVRRK
jgi:hypothetical protein